MASPLRAQITWQQYEDPTLTWGNEGDKDSPYRLFLARHLLPFIGDVTGQSVLDIGSGTGWLVHLLGQRGATPLQGVEPSGYAKLAARHYPEATFHQLAFEDFEAPTATFDVITLIMSTEVMVAVASALKKCAKLLKPKGRVVLCKGNYAYFLADKYDYVITREEVIPGQEAYVKTERPTGYGTTIDVYRSTQRVVEIASQSGLAVHGKVLPFTPDAELIEAVARYRDFADQSIMELIDFRLKPDEQ